MQQELDEWQNRLEGHFQSLATTRAGSGFPIFALEHGLESEELDEIGSLLRSRLRAGLHLSRHWLLWVIYATERGYAYAGDEYWRSFEEQTPRWDTANRDHLVPWFRKFQSNFDGVIPSGPWAEHFRIIAWPITHAILPKYLQRQFARALYDLRYRLAGMHSASASEIGRLLAVHSGWESSRFQKFLQQEELTGRIVLALLDRSPEAGKEPIDPITLERIVSDLVAVRSSREWLKETRLVVKDRFHGIGSGSGPSAYRPRDDAALPIRATGFGVTPSLVLQHRGRGAWALSVEVPSFRSVATVNPELQKFLRETRCRLNGAEDLKPRAWLLSGNRKGVLRTWPDSSKSMIEFEEANAEIEHILESECRLKNGPYWLFKISNDGTAREISGRIVRPNSDYVLVGTGKFSDGPLWANPCTVDCEGAVGLRLQVPPQLTADDTKWLGNLGLQVARTIRVWPAGLPGRKWDGEGYCEWLTTESPCLGLVNDHPVDSYVVQLDGESEATIEAGPVGHPIFVQLNPLSEGPHKLNVKAGRASSLDDIGTPPAEGYIVMNVREPEAWTPGLTSHPGLIVNLDPPDADLDEFWRNEIGLSVMGPAGHSVSLRASLEAGDGTEILSEQLATQVDLPITTEYWHKMFGRFTDDEQIAWQYLEAASGSLTIDGETLGQCTLRFEHDVPPLRWVLRRDHANLILRMVDDTGIDDGELTAYTLSMKRPLEEVRLEVRDAVDGIVVEPPGALFSVKRANYRDDVMASTGVAGYGLQGLGTGSEFPEAQSCTLKFAAIIRILALWQDARLSGFLAHIRRAEITDGILKALYGAICGEEWVRAENMFRADSLGDRGKLALQSAVNKRPGFAAVLRRDYARLNEDIAEGCDWFADLAKRYKVCKDSEVCRFALELASAPPRVLPRGDDEITERTKQLLQSPSVLRGARMLALLCANPDGSPTFHRLPRWSW